MRIITFNIRDGGIGREHLILEVLRSVQADVILLQEVAYPKTIEDFANHLGMAAVVSGGSSYRHVAILSRYTIQSWKSYTSVPGLSRDFLAATIEYQPKQFLNIFCVHLAAQPFFPFECLRLIEINAVLKQAVDQPSIPCIIAGDFNSVSPSDTPILARFPRHLRALMLLQVNYFPRIVIRRVVAAKFVDCYRALNSDPGSTLPPPNPTVRYDYIFANSMLNPLLQTCVVVQTPSAVERASDHYPLIAEFRL